MGRTVWHVDDTAPPDGDGLAWETAFRSLQDALNLAEEFDEIRVAGGLYLPTRLTEPPDARSASFEMANELAIRGGYAGYGTTDPNARDLHAHPSVLSGDLNGDDGPDFSNRADNCYHIFYNPEGSGLDETAVLEGFTLYGANADSFDPHNTGGGMLNKRCGSPSVIRCTFLENMAAFGGGAVYNDGQGVSPHFEDCVFEGNKANVGGAIYNIHYVKHACTRCLFHDNKADFGGGAVWNEIGANTFFTHCVFRNNTAYWGGAMINYIDSLPRIVNCVFTENTAIDYGGALYNFIRGKPRLTNCTFSGNTAGTAGGGICNDQNGDPVLGNCILWGDTSGDPPVADEIVNLDGASSTIVTYSNVQGGYPGVGNIDVDPLFVDAAGFDTHLTYDSPCRDVADESLVIETEDFEGDPRSFGAGVDMGADEFHTHFYCTGDFTAGEWIEGKFVGFPGTLAVGLLLGSGLLDPPLYHKWGPFYLESPWILIAPLGSISANGVLEIPAQLPATPTAPYSIFMQAIIGAELSNPFVMEING